MRAPSTFGAPPPCRSSSCHLTQGAAGGRSKAAQALAEPEQSTVLGNEPDGMSETGLGRPKTDISKSYDHALFAWTWKVWPLAGWASIRDEMESAKASAKRKSPRRTGTAGSEREIGATAHPTLPGAQQWQAWSCSCHFVWNRGKPTRSCPGKATGSARRPTRCEGWPSAVGAAGGERDGGDLGVLGAQKRRIGRPKRLGGQ